jgi:hypothetical protein
MIYVVCAIHNLGQLIRSTLSCVSGRRFHGLDTVARGGQEGMWVVRFFNRVPIDCSLLPSSTRSRPEVTSEWPVAWFSYQSNSRFKTGQEGSMGVATPEDVFTLFRLVSDQNSAHSKSCSTPKLHTQMSGSPVVNVRS